jgi:hypothetical protein
LAVIPWIVSRCVVVTTVTPVATRPITWRSSRAVASTAAAFGVSLAIPVGASSELHPGVDPRAPRIGLGGGISAVLAEWDGATRCEHTRDRWLYPSPDYGSRSAVDICSRRVVVQRTGYPPRRFWTLMAWPTRSANPQG